MLDLVGSQPIHVTPLQSTLRFANSLPWPLHSLLELGWATSPASLLVSSLCFLCSSSTGCLVPFRTFPLKSLSLSVSSSWMFFPLCVCISDSFTSLNLLKCSPLCRPHAHNLKGPLLVSLYPSPCSVFPYHSLPHAALLECVCLPFHCVSPSEAWNSLEQECILSVVVSP